MTQQLSSPNRLRERTCRSCGRQFMPHHGAARHCLSSPYCRGDPAVYRFVCPDGRSYVGSRMNTHNRHRQVIANNKRVRATLDRYPPETWTFEILEWLPRHDPFLRKQYEAEQRHIDRLRTRSPEFGFNIFPALPARHAGREYYFGRRTDQVKPRLQDDAA
jgi:hypothetical protein